MHKTYWQSFSAAAWLGWQVEANWTKPVFFVLYTVARPLALAGILVMLWAAVTHGDFHSPLFAYLYVGNAFYTYVGAVMSGMSIAVIDDRERYHTLRSVYVAPVDIRLYMVGRGMARFVIDSVAVAITLLVGIAFLHIPLHLRAADWPLFVVTFATGIAALAMLGLIVSSIALLLPDSAWSFGDGVAAALYLFSGAVFPIRVLPRVFQPIGFAIPITYWLELLRRCLLGSTTRALSLTGFSNLDLLRILVLLTALSAVAALGIFRWCDHAARERGMIDRVTNH